MNRNANDGLLAILGQQTVERFAASAPDPEKGWRTLWHLEPLPYFPVLEALADHIGDCQQCFADIDTEAETTCEEAMILELAGRFEIGQQFATSLLN